jgi:hypothetical protein
MSHEATWYSRFSRESKTTSYRIPVGLSVRNSRFCGEKMTRQTEHPSDDNDVFQIFWKQQTNYQRIFLLSTRNAIPDFLENQNTTYRLSI